MSKVPITRLKKRADFIAAAQKGHKAVSYGLVLQAKPFVADSPLEVPSIRLGFTVTKQVGNAVVRNRVKRRLRAAAMEIIPHYASPCFDYVIIGRQGTLTRSFPELLGDIKYTLKRAGTYRDMGCVQ